MQKKGVSNPLMTSNKIGESESNREESGLVTLLNEENDQRKATSLSYLDGEPLVCEAPKEKSSSRNCKSPGLASASSEEERSIKVSVKSDSILQDSLNSSESGSTEYRNPFAADDFEEHIPFLANSRSTSLWSVTSNQSSRSYLSRISPLIKSNHYRKMSKAEDRDSVAASRENIEKNPAETSSPSGKGDAGIEGDVSAGSRRDLYTSHTSLQNKTEVAQEDEKPEKKKRKARGLPLPVRAFKSRNERDPEFVNQDLRVNFEDVIAEPKGYYTAKFAWNLSQEIYGFGKGCCYSTASLFCGIPAAFIWGIWFSILACINVWCLVPLRRTHSINMSCFQACWGVIISSICDPIYQSMGMVFNNMNVRKEKYEV